MNDDHSSIPATTTQAPSRRRARRRRVPKRPDLDWGLVVDPVRGLVVRLKPRVLAAIWSKFWPMLATSATCAYLTS